MNSPSLALIGLLTAISTFGFAQPKEIRIEFIGNCGLHFTDGTTNLYSDFPYKSGAYGYMEFETRELERIRENSIFLFTHKHADHFSKRNMKAALKAKGGKKYTPAKRKKLTQLNESIPDFQIEAFQTKHRFSISHCSYLITWHGKKIFLSGDTEHAELVGSLKGIDWAFVPYWILTDAKEKGIEIDADMTAVYHLYPSEIQEARESFSPVGHIIPMADQGEIMTIELVD